MISKLVHGNTYALKARDGRGVVRAAYILDPTRVKPLVSSDGGVFYQLVQSELAIDRGVDRRAGARDDARHHGAAVP